MAREATTDVVLRILAKYQNTLTHGSPAKVEVGGDMLRTRLETGVSANQANRAWERRGVVVGSGATLDIDLYGLVGQDVGAGDGRDALGRTWVCKEIVLLLIVQTAGPGRLEINPIGGASNPLAWTPSGFATVGNAGALHAGAARMWYQPDTDALPVTNGSSQRLRVRANGGDVTFSICVVGRHDVDESSSSSNTSSTATSKSTGSSSTQS